jgi:hypothetical protein
MIGGMTTPVTFKIAPSQRIYLLVIGGLLAGLRVIDGDYVFAAVLGVGFLAGYLLQGTSKTAVTDSGIGRSGGLWTKKSVAWNDVASVEEMSMLGTKSVRIVTARERVRLPAPIDGFMTGDPEYGEKLDLIRRTWQEQAPEAAGVASA